MEMLLDDFKKKKRETENQIIDLLQKFQEETGVILEEVRIGTQWINTQGKEHRGLRLLLDKCEIFFKF